MIMPSDLKASLLALVPSLRAFAYCLSQSQPEADELVSSSLGEIWARHVAKGSRNLKVAAFAAMRARFSRREAANATGPRAGTKPGTVEPGSFAASFNSLSRPEREAVSLVGVWGFTCEQAAEICGCDPETVERRVAMACRRLAVDGQRSNPAARRPPVQVGGATAARSSFRAVPPAVSTF